MSTREDKDGPIGVFDSGLGGLTVVRELMRQLPSEDIVYFGDTARVPYGTKSKEAIIRFSRENTRILLQYKVKMVVVACNTSSSYALDILRKEFRVPIVGVIGPGARKAIAMTKAGNVGVIATSATVASGQYEKSIKQCDGGIRVVSQACPLFVPLAEEGWADKPVTFEIAREYLKPLKKSGIDTLILGCTHYPLLKAALQKAVGKSVVLVDSAKEVALEVDGILTSLGRKRTEKKVGRYRFLISDRPQAFKKLAKNFLGREIKHIQKV
ncbi:MAG TPA: glutamate racemase [Candidatus Omnitrophota bacterium]|nr:glutamate racemase [Candidatus Omnitrophota bacterium]